MRISEEELYDRCQEYLPKHWVNALFDAFEVNGGYSHVLRTAIVGCDSNRASMISDIQRMYSQTLSTMVYLMVAWISALVLLLSVLRSVELDLVKTICLIAIPAALHASYLSNQLAMTKQRYAIDIVDQLRLFAIRKI